jgi:hypothetical protein
MDITQYRCRNQARCDCADIEDRRKDKRLILEAQKVAVCW